MTDIDALLAAVHSGDRMAMGPLTDALLEAGRSEEAEAWAWMHGEGKWPTGPVPPLHYKSVYIKDRWDWFPVDYPSILQEATLPDSLFRLAFTIYDTLPESLADLVQAFVRARKKGWQP